MEMFREYLQEREGKNIIIDSERGFATFEIQNVQNQKIVYIQDIYVRSEFRKHNVASKMADEVCKYSRKQGIKKLIGSVDLRTNGSDISMKVLLGYGMKPYLCDDQVIFFQKEI